LLDGKIREVLEAKKRALQVRFVKLQVEVAAQHTEYTDEVLSRPAAGFRGRPDGIRPRYTGLERRCCGKNGCSRLPRSPSGEDGSCGAALSGARCSLQLCKEAGTAPL